MTYDPLSGLADHILAEAAQLGTAAHLLADTNRKMLSISALIAWLSTPIRLGQAAFVHSDEGRPVAYATWAFLDDETADRMRTGQLELLSPEDWNDGERLWIIDVVAPYGHLRELLLALESRLSLTHPHFEYVRSRQGALRSSTAQFRRGKQPRRPG